MLEKIKNFYGSHPIRWTLLTLALVAGIAALLYFAPAFSLTAGEPPMEAPAKSEVGEEIVIGVNYLYKGTNKRKAYTLITTGGLDYYTIFI